MEISEVKTCEACSRPIRGRTDKKFCNDYCRNIFHNNRKMQSPAAVQKINQLLIKNHRIISGFFREGIQLTLLHKDLLTENGFIFYYFTHQKIGFAGSVYRFCYDCGYLELERGKLLLIKETTTIY